MNLQFAKYRALGNRFIVIDEIQSPGRQKSFSTLAERLCDGASGIGADGMLILSRPGDLFRVDIYNADGSWAEKSGNGVRIAAMHLHNAGHLAGATAQLETGSGVSDIVFGRGDTNRRTISATLGKPEFRAEHIPVKASEKYFINQTIRLAGRAYIGSAVSVGNPHLVLFCDDFDFDWPAIGAALESDPLFPNRINVGFVIVRGLDEIEVRDFERGVGPTESSGTGAAAAVAIAVMRGFTRRTVHVQTQAGVLDVTWDEKTDALGITGPVECMYSGEYAAT